MFFSHDFSAAATLSNVLRFSTTSKTSFKILENKNVAQFVFPKLNVAPVMASVILFV